MGGECMGFTQSAQGGLLAGSRAGGSGTGNPLCIGSAYFKMWCNVEMSDGLEEGGGDRSGWQMGRVLL